MKKEDYEFGYYSKILNKPFDSLDELKAAEDEFNKAEEEKKAKSLAKKEDAQKVEEAFKNLNSVKQSYNEERAKILSEYYEALKSAKEEYNNKLDAISQKVDEAEKVYDNALKEFNDAHPEGFHITLKDGDNVVSMSRKVSDNLDDFMSFDFGDLWEFVTKKFFD